MSWIPVLIALCVGAALGAVGMFVFGPRRASSAVRSLPGPESQGALPFSASPRRATGALSAEVKSNMTTAMETPEGSFVSPALDALVADLSAAGVEGLALKYEHSEVEHLRAFRGSWSGSLRFGGADRTASFMVSVYNNAPDEIWFNASIHHGVELGIIPYMRADQVEGDTWSLQRADGVPSARAIAAVRSDGFYRACAAVSGSHEPAGDAIWALTMTSDALMPVYRVDGAGHSPLALLETIYESFSGARFTEPTRAELEQMLRDSSVDASIAREVARSLIDTAPSDAARTSATQLALAHESSDVRLTAVVDVVCRGGGKEYLGEVAQLLTEIQAASPSDALSGEIVESMLDALERLYPEDRHTAYVAALLGALTYRQPQRIRAAELARPLLVEGADRRGEPGVRTFAERILSELNPRDDLDAFIGWMEVSSSAYYTGAGFDKAIEVGGLDAAQLERVLAVAYAHADGSYYQSDLLGKAQRAGEPCPGWRQIVWRVFGAEWVDREISNFLTTEGVSFESALGAAPLLGGALTRARLLKMSKGRGPRRAEAEEALARLDDRAATGGLSVAEGGVSGGLSDASSSGGLSDA